MESVRANLVLLGIYARTPRLRGGFLTYALAGTILIELTMAERVVIDDKNRVDVTGSMNPVSPLAEEGYSLIAAVKKHRDTNHWITLFAHKIPQLVERSAEPLVMSGLLRIERKKWLGIFPYRIFELTDKNHRELLIANLLDMLRGHRDFEPEMIHLVQLAHAAGILASWMPREERKFLIGRIKEIGRDELVAKAVDAATAAVAASVAISTAAASSASSS